MNMQNNQPQKYDRVFLGALAVLAALILVCLLLAAALGIAKLTASANSSTNTDTEETTTPEDSSVSVDPQTLILGESPDAGMAYIDRMIFFGESTTAHLRARGVLSGGTETQQVWQNDSGTMRLSSRITSELISYPPTGNSVTIAQACAAEKPDYVVLSFGLNGLTSFAANDAGKSSYVNNYCKLIRAIEQASPDTRIILQTVYPICNAGNFTEDLATLNGYILKLNSYLPEIAAAFENVRVVDTASVLRDAENALLAEYDNGDGQHLTTQAYEAILAYMRTHAWQ